MTVTFKPSSSEIDEVIKEEYDAMLDYTSLNNMSSDIELRKRAARVRLMNARGAKKALFDDLMSV